MARRTALALFCVLLLLILLPSVTVAQTVVSLNFGQTALNASDETGVVASQNWNNRDGSSGNESDLVDSDGSTVAGLTIAWSWYSSLNNQNAGATGTAIGKLFDGRLHELAGNPGVDITVSGGVFAAGYDLYIYCWNNRADLSSEGNAFTVDGTTKHVRGPQNDGQGTSFLEGSQVWDDTPQKANYVKFEGLSGNITIECGIDDHCDRLGISAIQLVAMESPSAGTVFYIR